MNSKAAILAAVVLLFDNVLISQQLTVTTFTRSPIPSSFYSWVSDPSLFQIVVAHKGSGQEIRNVHIEYYVRDIRRGEIVVRTKANHLTLPRFDIQTAPSTVRKTGPEIISDEGVDVLGSARQNAISLGAIPDGDYEFCVWLVDENGTKLTEEGGASSCSRFSVTTPPPVFLLVPADKTILRTSPTTLFQWSGIKNYREKPFYTFRIVPKFKSQSTIFAISNNEPIIEERNLLVPQVRIVNPQQFWNLYPFAESFVWQVTVSDEFGNPATTNGGKSDIFEFTWDKTSGTSQDERNPRLKDSVIGSKTISSALIDGQKPIASPRMKPPPDLGKSIDQGFLRFFRISGSSSTGFLIKLANQLVLSDSTYSGDGSTFIPILGREIRVRFQDIRLTIENDTAVAIAGSAKSIENPKEAFGMALIEFNRFDFSPVKCTAELGFDLKSATKSNEFEMQASLSKIACTANGIDQIIESPTCKIQSSLGSCYIFEADTFVLRIAPTTGENVGFHYLLVANRHSPFPALRLIAQESEASPLVVETLVEKKVVMIRSTSLPLSINGSEFVLHEPNPVVGGLGFCASPNSNQALRLLNGKVTAKFLNADTMIFRADSILLSCNGELSTSFEAELTDAQTTVRGFDVSIQRLTMSVCGDVLRSVRGQGTLSIPNSISLPEKWSALRSIPVSISCDSKWNLIVTFDNTKIELPFDSHATLSIKHISLENGYDQFGVLTLTNGSLNFKTKSGTVALPIEGIHLGANGTVTSTPIAGWRKLQRWKRVDFDSTAIDVNEVGVGYDASKTLSARWWYGISGDIESLPNLGAHVGDDIGWRIEHAQFYVDGSFTAKETPVGFSFNHFFSSAGFTKPTDQSLSQFAGTARTSLPFLSSLSFPTEHRMTTREIRIRSQTPLNLNTPHLIYSTAHFEPRIFSATLSSRNKSTVDISGEFTAFPQTSFAKKFRTRFQGGATTLLFGKGETESFSIAFLSNKPRHIGANLATAGNGVLSTARPILSSYQTVGPFNTVLQRSPCDEVLIGANSISGARSTMIDLENQSQAIYFLNESVVRIAPNKRVTGVVSSNDLFNVSANVSLLNKTENYYEPLFATVQAGVNGREFIAPSPTPAITWKIESSIPVVQSKKKTIRPVIDSSRVLARNNQPTPLGIVSSQPFSQEHDVSLDPLFVVHFDVPLSVPDPTADTSFLKNWYVHGAQVELIAKGSNQPINVKWKEEGNRLFAETTTSALQPEAEYLLAVHYQLRNEIGTVQETDKSDTVGFTTGFRGLRSRLLAGSSESSPIQFSSSRNSLRKLDVQFDRLFASSIRSNASEDCEIDSVGTASISQKLASEGVNLGIKFDNGSIRRVASSMYTAPHSQILERVKSVRLVGLEKLTSSIVLESEVDFNSKLLVLVSLLATDGSVSSSSRVVNLTLNSSGIPSLDLTSLFGSFDSSFGVARIQLYSTLDSRLLYCYSDGDLPCREVVSTQEFDR